jgi:hypothetical protein
LFPFSISTCKKGVNQEEEKRLGPILDEIRKNKRKQKEAEKVYCRPFFASFFMPFLQNRPNMREIILKKID